MPFLPPNQQRQSTEGYMTLPVFAAERRRLLHGAPAAGTRCRRPRISIDILCPQGAQQKKTRRTPLLLSIDGTDRPTDRRTDARAFHGPCCAYHAGGVNNRSQLAMRCDPIMAQNRHEQLTFLACVADAFHIHTSLLQFRRDLKTALFQSS